MIVLLQCTRTQAFFFINLFFFFQMADSDIAKMSSQSEFWCVLADGSTLPVRS